MCACMVFVCVIEIVREDNFTQLRIGMQILCFTGFLQNSGLLSYAVSRFGYCTLLPVCALRLPA